jgi:predicted nucleic acid-binding protein
MISGPVVVDASVLVEYLLPGDLWPAAQRVIGDFAAGDIEIWAPDLLYVEAVAAVRRMARLRMVAAADAARVVGWLSRFTVSTTGVHQDIGAIWERRDTLTPYDAAYSALAARLGVPLITSDQGLATAHGRAGGKAFLLREYPTRPQEPGAAP